MWIYQLAVCVWEKDKWENNRKRSKETNYLSSNCHFVIVQININFEALHLINYITINCEMEGEQLATKDKSSCWSTRTTSSHFIPHLHLPELWTALVFSLLMFLMTAAMSTNSLGCGENIHSHVLHCFALNIMHVWSGSWRCGSTDTDILPFTGWQHLTKEASLICTVEAYTVYLPSWDCTKLGPVP